MATIRPIRTCFYAEPSCMVWWEPTGIGNVISTGSFLRVGKSDTDPSPSIVHARIALKFPTTMPAWTALGSVTERTPILRLFVIRRSVGASGGTVLRAGYVDAGDTWDTTSSVAYMEGTVMPGVSTWLGSLPSGRGGWIAWHLDDAGAAGALRGEGIVIEVEGTNEEELYIAMDPPPRASFHYQYAVTTTVHAQSEVRTSLSDAAIRQISGRGGSVSLETSILASEVFPAESDVDFVEVTKDTRGTVLFTGGGWPKSWVLSGGGRSGLCVPAPADPSIAQSWRGLEVEHSIYVKPDDEAESLIGRNRGVIKGATSWLNGKFEISAEDSLQAAMERKPYRREEITGFDGVNWANDPCITILVDALLGSTGFHWQRVFWNDIVWLGMRFGMVWPTITITALEASALTVATLLKAICQRYSWCVSRTANGLLSAWHPAAWRPSFRVFDLDLDLFEHTDCNVSVLDDEIPARRVTLENEAAEHGNSYGHLALDPGIDVTDLIEDLGVMKGDDLDYEEARDAIAEQYAQRVCSARKVIEVTLPAEWLEMQRGDQVRISCDQHHLAGTPCLVLETSVDSTAGQNRAKMIHYPDSWGLHSCFSSGEVQGIYRWWDWNADDYSYATMAWEGTAGAFTAVAAPTTHVHAAWEGLLIAKSSGMQLTGPNGFGVDATAGLTDLMDLFVGVFGNQQELYGGGGTEDDNYHWLVRIAKSARPTQAILMGIYRPYDASYGYSSTRNKWFCGYTTDYTAIPIVWTSIVYAQPGVGRDWTGLPHTTLHVDPVGYQWLDSALNFYVCGDLVGTLALAKTEFDRFYLRSGLTSATSYNSTYIGPLRWMKRTGSVPFDKREMFVRNGRDPYYK